MQGEKMEGSVKWFNSRKGFGFIKGDDDEDYFVHYTALDKGVFLRENDRVEFLAAQTEKGKQAQKVVLLKKGRDLSNKQDDQEESDEFREEE